MIAASNILGNSLLAYISWYDLKSLIISKMLNSWSMKSRSIPMTVFFLDLAFIWNGIVLGPNLLVAQDIWETNFLEARLIFKSVNIRWPKFQGQISRFRYLNFFKIFLISSCWSSAKSFLAFKWHFITFKRERYFYTCALLKAFSLKTSPNTKTV